MTRIFYYAWEKPACCVSKISSDCGCQSKETGVGMEVRLLSVGTRGFFSSLRDSPSRLRRSILSLPTRKNTSGTQGIINNGLSSDYFTLTRGVRQGDPLLRTSFFWSLKLWQFLFAKTQKSTELKLATMKQKFCNMQTTPLRCYQIKTQQRLYFNY